MSKFFRHFSYKYIRPDLTEVIEPYAALAQHINDLLATSPEKDLAMQRLLESCDSALRGRMVDLDNTAKDSAINQLKDVLYPQAPVTEQRIPHG